MCSLVGWWSSAYVQDSGRVIVDRTVRVAMNPACYAMLTQCLDHVLTPSFAVYILLRPVKMPRARLEERTAHSCRPEPGSRARP
jgi:hypothetical protein